jgi:hypothetical protein
MARLKSYYTTDEITNDLYTFGNELMTADNVEYVGPYHRYSTGEIYTQFQWNPKTSVRLVPYISINAPTTRYRELKSYNLNSQQPKQIPCTPNRNDIAKGYVTRYFVGKLNESLVVEINAEQWLLWEQAQIDRILFGGITIDWAITGPLQDTITNGITTPGVVTRNRQAVIAASKALPQIISTLSNLTEFYTDSDFTVPKDINQLDS